MPLVRLGALFVVVAGLKAAEPVFIPMLLAFFLAVLSFPLQALLMRWGVRPALALAATVTGVLVVILVFGLLINRAVVGFLIAMPAYQDRLVAMAREWLTLASARGLEVSDWLAAETFDVSNYFDIASGIVGGTVRGVASLLSLLLMTVVALIFMLAEAYGAGDKLRAAFGNRRDLIDHLAGITRSTQRYVGVKTLVSALTGIAVIAWTSLLGIEFPLVWGVVAFFLHFVPAVGAFIAAGPTILVALAQYGWGRAFGVAVGYLAIGVVLGNIVEPALMGRRLGLSPLAVLVALVFWGWLWGPIGMLLSVPVTMILKIALEHSKDFRWLAILLSPNPKRPAAPQ
jgi:predicted PurR-regulated permease PerM